MTEFDLPDKVKDLIASDERVLFVAKQKAGLISLDLTERLMPDMAIVTDIRLIHVHPKGLIRGALGLQDYVDYLFNDMANISVDQGMQRSTLKITLKFGGKLGEIRDLPNDAAADIFKIAREQLERTRTQTTQPIVQEYKQQVMPPPPPPDAGAIQLNCPYCGKPTTYIAQYQRRYCFNCKEYI